MAVTRNIADISKEEHNKRLGLQEKESKWHKFVEGNLILKQGLLDKRKVGFLNTRLKVPHTALMFCVNMLYDRLPKYNGRGVLVMQFTLV